MIEFKDIFGNNIRLSEERLRHLLENHPELNNFDFEQYINESLLNPDYIIQSNSDETVELYYNYYFTSTIGDKWLCVVVKKLNIDSFIITVYFTDKIKQGGLLWKKK